MIKLFLALIFSTQLSALPNQKIYIDKNEVDSSYDGFKIHTGNNVWIETKTMHNDEMGLYIIESSILREGEDLSSEYVQKWKCPYCSMHWPKGQKCNNADCPSKYKCEI